jgi:hypothetical protein
MNARETGEAGVHRGRVFELWDACTSGEWRTEKALSAAMHIARNAGFVMLCKECAAHSKKRQKPARHQGQAHCNEVKRLD